VIQAPPEELCVACRNKDPEAHERMCGAEESDEVLVGLGDRVPAVAKAGCITADAFGAFYDMCRSGGDRVAKLTAAVVAVDAGAQLVARGQVVFARWADSEAREAERRWGSLDDRERLTDDEAELRVQLGIGSGRPSERA
jgi:hypothetical protein